MGLVNAFGATQVFGEQVRRALCRHNQTRYKSLPVA